MSLKNLHKEQDYYKTLGLKKNCTKKEIKKQFHKLALKYHPDKNDNSQESKVRFSGIQQAYEILSNDKLRRTYDKHGFEGLEMEQKCEELVKNNSDHFFYKTGFAGTNRSAFDFLRDILEEDDDEEEESSEYDSSIFSDDFKSTMKSYFDNNMESTDSDTDDFTMRYKPTFMDNDFLKSSDFLKKQMANGQSYGVEQSYESVSDGNGNNYTRTISSNLVNGKGKAILKETIKKGDVCYENTEEKDIDLTKKDNMKALPMQNTKEKRPLFLMADLDDTSEEESFAPGLAQSSKKILKEKVH